MKLLYISKYFFFFWLLLINNSCSKLHTDTVPARCSYHQWSEPDSLSFGTNVGRFQDPTLAPSADTLYIAAQTVPRASRIGIPEAISENARYSLPSSLWVGRLPGPESLRKPTGNFVFQRVQGIADSTGSFHLVWAEPHPDSLQNLRSASVREEFPTLLRTEAVYYSLYSEGEWSPAERIYERPEPSEQIVWSTSQKPELQLGPEGVVHILFGSISTGGGRTIHLRRQTDGTWHKDTLRSMYGDHHALVLGDSGRVVHAYVGNAGDDSGSVLVVRSEDGGHTWGDTTVVRRGSPGPGWRQKANAIKLLGSVSDTLHLIWGWNETGSAAVTHKLVHAQSTDGGQTWNAPTSVDLPHLPMMDLEFVQGKCGRLHGFALMLEPRTLNGQKRMFGRIHYLQWEGENWSSFKSLTKTSKSVTGMGVTRWQNKIWLTWGEMSTWKPGSPVTIYQRSRALQSGVGAGK